MGTGTENVLVMCVWNHTEICSVEERDFPHPLASQPLAYPTNSFSPLISTSGIARVKPPDERECHWKLNNKNNTYATRFSMHNSAAVISRHKTTPPSCVLLRIMWNLFAPLPPSASTLCISAACSAGARHTRAPESWLLMRRHSPVFPLRPLFTTWKTGSCGISALVQPDSYLICWREARRGKSPPRLRFA